ncbi:MAG: hypothetical protein IH571_02250 [Acholeplasmataceae bacterium]|nr:hypothetical protein [Acholeplasmataceae bacterium]
MHIQGIGTISLLVAKHAKAVIAVEVNSTAHLDAVQNKRINIFDNVIFKNEDVESFMQGCQDRIDVLMMDPTRDGLSKAFIDAVLEMKPKKIVYISCEVKTQVRDLKHFMHHYQVTTVQPLDMFSQTAHTENIAVLELKKAIVH